MIQDVTWEPDDVLDFGPFRLFPAHRLLERAGVPVRLGDRAFDVLLILVGHAADIVGKTTLLERVWPDVTVEEGSLRVQMTALRKALGDGEDGIRYVATVQGRGYRFVAPVTRAKHALDQSEAPPARPDRVASHDHTIRTIAEQLWARRFVTLVGPPGVGKSSMAKVVAFQLRDGYRHGVRVLDFAGIDDPARVSGLLAEAVGLTDPAIPALAGFLGDKQMLLVLDNCEQVGAAAASTAESLLQAAPGLNILATGRTSFQAESAAEIEFAAPAPLEPAKAETNLPQRLATVIGRAAELAELRDSVARHRLVTLVGPGGIGKTRLAIELGWQVAGLFPNGVWLVDLAAVTDPAVVTSATATVLGVALRDAGSPVEAIAQAIGKERKLLIFDNCEHLLGAATALIAALLERVPGLSVLATSQENLHIPTEQVYRLNPLAVPPPDAIGTIADFGAVALFVERARAADRRFQLGADNAVGVAEICRRLDGMPLALEMAAARLPLLGMEGLRARLDERLRMLTTGPHTAEARHRTLRNMVDWSHGLLEPADQRVFRRLAIFAGSFSLDAVIAVAGEKTDNWDIIDTLGRLIDKSLVTAETGEQPRYRLLETLRLYALEELKRHGELDMIAERHARYCTDLFDRSDALWEAVSEAQWLEACRPEIGNVRAALDWALGVPERRQRAVALAGNTAHLWVTLALIAEGRHYVEQALALIDPETPPAAEARLLRAAGGLWSRSDRLRALAWFERAAALYRRIGDRLSLATALSSIGSTYASLGRNDEAKAALREAGEILSAGEQRRSLFTVMNNLGTLAGFMDEFADARRCFGRALDLARARKDLSQEYYVLINLAELEFASGSIDLAIGLAREAVGGLRSIHRRSVLELALINLVSYLILKGDLPEARAVAEEALSTAIEEGGFVVRLCLQQWALLGALDARHRDAAQLIGFVDAGYAASGDLQQPSARDVYDRLRQLLEAELPAADLQASAALGAQWSDQEAVAFAFNRLVPIAR